VMARHGSQRVRWFALLNEIVMFLIETSNAAARLSTISCA